LDYSLVQNLGLNEEARIRKQNKEKRRKKNTGAYIPPNIKVKR